MYGTGENVMTNSKRIRFTILFLFLSSHAFAYQVVDAIATKAGGYDIPIQEGTIIPFTSGLWKTTAGKAVGTISGNSRD
jgi:hypothetical protein